MMNLHTFGPALGQPDASPFCLKAMCLLRMSGVDWQLMPNSDVRKAPNKQLPVLHDGNLVVPDSDSIRYHLEQKTGVDFDQHLTDLQRAQSRSIIRMVEEHLYFCLVYDRWVDDASFRELRSQLFSALPAVARVFVPTLVRRSVLGNLSAQGLGRITYSQMLDRAQKDIASIDTIIDEQTFIFGDTPGAVDASVASVLSSIATSPLQSELSNLVLNNLRLTNYIDRAKVAIFPKLS